MEYAAALPEDARRPGNERRVSIFDVERERSPHAKLGEGLVLFRFRETASILAFVARELCVGPIL